MTDTHDKRTGKLAIYRHLYHLNRYLQRCDRAIKSLMVADVLQAELARVWENRIEELRAEMNCELTRTLAEREHADTRRLGQLNEARETGSAEPEPDIADDVEEPEPDA